MQVRAQQLPRAMAGRRSASECSPPVCSGRGALTWMDSQGVRPGRMSRRAACQVPCQDFALLMSTGRSSRTLVGRQGNGLGAGPLLPTAFVARIIQRAKRIITVDCLRCIIFAVRGFRGRGWFGD